jgi:hypothetical protein
MTALALIEELSVLGVKLVREGDRLRYRGPAAVITPELKQRILKQKAEIIVTLTQSENSAGRPSPENARRPVDERCAEALELLGELIEIFNDRASVLEFDAHFPRAEAERLATLEVCATETYRRWRALG